MKLLARFWIKFWQLRDCKEIVRVVGLFILHEDPIAAPFAPTLRGEGLRMRVSVFKCR